MRHTTLALVTFIVGLVSLTLGDADISTQTRGLKGRFARRLARQQRQQSDGEQATTVEPMTTTENRTTEEMMTVEELELTTPRPTINIDWWRNRERDKNIRLFTIQAEIIARLGLHRMPNVSSSGYSKEEIVRMGEAFNESVAAEPRYSNVGPPDYYAKQLRALTPSCNVPRNTDEAWKSPEAYRLYFIVEPSVGVLRKKTNVKLATLHLFKMPVAVDLQPLPSAVRTVERRRGRRRQNRRRQNRRAPRSSVRRRHTAVGGGTNGSGNNTSRAGRVRVRPVEKVEPFFNVSVYQYIRPVKNRRRTRKKLIDSVRVTRDFAGWIRLDIVEAVKFWFRRPQHNFGIEISVQDERRRTYTAAEVIANVNCSGDDEDMKRNVIPLGLLLGRNGGVSSARDTNYTDPDLEILSYEIPRERESRQKRRTSVGSSRKCRTCTKETFYVSFEELGWQDWIVQPEGFETAVCRGKCSKGWNKRGPNRIHRKEKVSPEKCGPSRMEALSILHYDDSGLLTVSVLDDFIVAECGCSP